MGVDRDEPFGRQLLPVTVSITGGHDEDRSYWQQRLTAWLNHQPCVTSSVDVPGPVRAFRIHPDANND